MATLDDVGETLTISMRDKGEAVAISIVGTYNMTLLFQREIGSPGSGAWETLRTFNTVDQTVAETHITEKYNEELRLIVTADTSGATTSLLTDSGLERHEYLTVKDRVGNVVAEYDQGGVQFPGSLRYGGSYDINADLTLTVREHAGRLGRFSNSVGKTVTLPVASGSGAKFRFVVEIAVVSSADVVEVAGAADVIQGNAIIMDSADATGSHFQADATFDTITLNGGTTGGDRGDYITVEDVSVGLYMCTVVATGGATQATPFSALVS